MARKRERHAGHPVLWLLLGFFCGVVAMLGAVLMLGGESASEGVLTAAPAPGHDPVQTPALTGAPPAGGPVAPIAPPSPVEPLAPLQDSGVSPNLPTVQPDGPTAPPVPARPVPARPAPSSSRSNADQIAEDLAASGMTARTR